MWSNCHLTLSVYIKNNLRKIIAKIRENIVFYAIYAIPRVRYVFNKSEGINKIKFKNKSKKCIVIGNGPSLKIDINRIKLDGGKSDLFGVNHFCESLEFKILKPSKYTLLDTYFWDSDACNELKEKRELMFAELNKVDWDMNLFLPSWSDKAYIQNKISNEKITIHYYKIIPVENVTISNAHVVKLFSSGVYGPAASNVLVYSLYIAIIAGYKEIDVYGADLSFHNDVIVDQFDNSLKIKYKHFYGEGDFVPLMKNPQRIECFRMSELMRQTYETFLAHDRLAMYSKKHSVIIRNKSSFSMIDSYSR